MSDGLGLGLDAGGTQTRWALANAAGEIVEEGAADGLTALQMGTETGRESMRATLAQIAEASGRKGTKVVAGMTGFGSQTGDLTQLIASALERVLTSDAERARLIAAGTQQVERYSWSECAHRTLQVLLSAR